MTKYRLEVDWNGYEKGHVFNLVDYGEIYIAKNDFNVRKEIIDLLVKCGALAEIKECEHPKSSRFFLKSYCDECGYEVSSEVKKIEPFLRADTENQTFDKLNLLVTAINHLLNTKLK